MLKHHTTIYTDEHDRRRRRSNVSDADTNKTQQNIHQHNSRHWTFLVVCNVLHLHDYGLFRYVYIFYMREKQWNHERLIFVVCVWVFLCEPYEKLHSLIRHMMHGIGMFDDENNKQFTRVQWNTSSICGSIDDNKKLRSNRHCTIVVSASFKHFGKNVHTEREKEQFIRMYNNRMNEAEFLIEYHGETVFVSDFLFPCIYPQFACITWLIYFFSFFFSLDSSF